MRDLVSFIHEVGGICTVFPRVGDLVHHFHWVVGHDTFLGSICLLHSSLSSKEITICGSFWKKIAVVYLGIIHTHDVEGIAAGWDMNPELCSW